MGLLGKVRSGLHKVKEGIKAVREEASHPGRPPSHKAADNPLWSPAAPTAQASIPPARSPSPAAEAAPAAKRATESKPWFLDGSEGTEGWDQTNPSDEWREIHEGKKG